MEPRYVFGASKADAAQYPDRGTTATGPAASERGSMGPAGGGLNPTPTTVPAATSQAAVPRFVTIIDVPSVVTAAATNEEAVHEASLQRDITTLAANIASCSHAIAGAHQELASLSAAALMTSTTAAQSHAQAMWQCASYTDFNVAQSIKTGEQLIEYVRQMSFSMRKVAQMRDDIARCQLALEGLESILAVEEAAFAKPKK